MTTRRSLKLCTAPPEAEELELVLEPPVKRKFYLGSVTGSNNQSSDALKNIVVLKPRDLLNKVSLPKLDSPKLPPRNDDAPKWAVEMMEMMVSTSQSMNQKLTHLADRLEKVEAAIKCTEGFFVTSKKKSEEILNEVKSIKTAARNIKTSARNIPVEPNQCEDVDFSGDDMICNPWEEMIKLPKFPIKDLKQMDKVIAKIQNDPAFRSKLKMFLQIRKSHCQEDMCAVFRQLFADSLLDEYGQAKNKSKRCTWECPMFILLQEAWQSLEFQNKDYRHFIRREFDKKKCRINSLRKKIPITNPVSSGQFESDDGDDGEEARAFD